MENAAVTEKYDFKEQEEKYDFEKMLHLASRKEAAFLALVSAESKKIPLSVRMFLADQIRNALMGMEDTERAEIIVRALDTVGI
jgi:hypothetical protein